VAVGFGVKSPEQARAIAKGADGVVVGSALVDAIRDTLDASGRGTKETAPRVLGLVESLARGLQAA
jgi:tryptophan synthase alpha chain